MQMSLCLPYSHSPYLRQEKHFRPSCSSSRPSLRRPSQWSPLCGLHSPCDFSSKGFYKQTSCYSSAMPVKAGTISTTEISFAEDSLSYARAYWVTRSIIAWKVKPDDTFCYLYASKCGSLFITNDGVEGYDVKIQLDLDKNRIPANITEKFPHILGYKAFKVTPSLDVRNLLKCQLAIASFDADGKCSSVTALQLPGVLDDLFSYTGPLGAVFSKDSISLHLWAPTAQMVSAFIYSEPSGGEPSETLQLEEVNGVWSVHGPRSWEGSYYVYEVYVYHPSTQKIERCTLNDPYARGLSSDGQRSLFVNLDSDALKPDGWDELVLEKPELPSFTDISIYESHIRDFRLTSHTLTVFFS